MNEQSNSSIDETLNTTSRFSFNNSLFRRNHLNKVCWVGLITIALIIASISCYYLNKSKDNISTSKDTLDKISAKKDTLLVKYFQIDSWDNPELGLAGFSSGPLSAKGKGIQMQLFSPNRKRISKTDFVCEEGKNIEGVTGDYYVVALEDVSATTPLDTYFLGEIFYPTDPYIDDQAAGFDKISLVGTQQESYALTFRESCYDARVLLFTFDAGSNKIQTVNFKKINGAVQDHILIPKGFRTTRIVDKDIVSSAYNSKTKLRDETRYRYNSDKFLYEEVETVSLPHDYSYKPTQPIQELSIPASVRFAASGAIFTNNLNTGEIVKSDISGELSPNGKFSFRASDEEINNKYICTRSIVNLQSGNEYVDSYEGGCGGPGGWSAHIRWLDNGTHSFLLGGGTERLINLKTMSVIANISGSPGSFSDDYEYFYYTTNENRISLGDFYGNLGFLRVFNNSSTLVEEFTPSKTEGQSFQCWNQHSAVIRRVVYSEPLENSEVQGELIDSEYYFYNLDNKQKTIICENSGDCEQQVSQICPRNVVPSPNPFGDIEKDIVENYALDNVLVVEDKLVGNNTYILLAANKKFDQSGSYVRISDKKFIFIWDKQNNLIYEVGEGEYPRWVN